MVNNTLFLKLLHMIQVLIRELHSYIVNLVYLGIYSSKCVLKMC